MTKHDIHIRDIIEENARNEPLWAIAYAICELADAHDKLASQNFSTFHPLQGQTFDGLVSALNDIGLALGGYGDLDPAEVDRELAKLKERAPKRRK